MRRKLIASASAVVLLIFSSCTFQEKYDYQRIMQKTELKSFASLENPLILRMYIPLQFSLKIKPDSVHTKGYKTIYLVYDWKKDIFHDFVYSDVSDPIETFSQELKDSSAVTNHYYISGDKSKVICLNPSGGKPTVIPIPQIDEHPAYTSWGFSQYQPSRFATVSSRYYAKNASGKSERLGSVWLLDADTGFSPKKINYSASSSFCPEYLTQDSDENFWLLYDDPEHAELKNLCRLNVASEKFEPPIVQLNKVVNKNYNYDYTLKCITPDHLILGNHESDLQQFIVTVNKSTHETKKCYLPSGFSKYAHAEMVFVNGKVYTFISDNSKASVYTFDPHLTQFSDKLAEIDSNYLSEYKVRGSRIYFRKRFLADGKISLAFFDVADLSIKTARTFTTATLMEKLEE